MRRLLLVACDYCCLAQLNRLTQAVMLSPKMVGYAYGCIKRPHRGKREGSLWTLDFPKGASKPISDADAGPNKRIRWDYTTDPNDHHGHGNVGASCINNSRLLIP